MNIKDYNETTLRTWDEIFKLQYEINNQFDPTYKENKENFDISYAPDQETFKHYCWCITEELCEALEAVELNEPFHIKEEVVDALNFTIQLMALYGWSTKDLEFFNPDNKEDLKTSVLDTIYKLGLVANCLKNRQWRESQYLVDLYIFEPRLKEVWISVIKVFGAIGIHTDEEIRRLWDLKYQVNKFRIESKY